MRAVRSWIKIFLVLGLMTPIVGKACDFCRSKTPVADKSSEAKPQTSQTPTTSTNTPALTQRKTQNFLSGDEFFASVGKAAQPEPSSRRIRMIRTGIYE